MEADQSGENDVTLCQCEGPGAGDTSVLMCTYKGGFYCSKQIGKRRENCSGGTGVTAACGGCLALMLTWCLGTSVVLCF